MYHLLVMYLDARFWGHSCCGQSRKDALAEQHLLGFIVLSVLQRYCVLILMDYQYPIDHQVLTAKTTLFPAASVVSLLGNWLGYV